MKNLIGAVAPTNRVLGSFKFLMLIVLVAIGFTSCKDQSKKEVSPETELIAKSVLQDVQSNFDTGGGKNSNGGIEKPSDTGGKGTSSDTGQLYSVYNSENLDTGGRGNELGKGGISDTGGSKGRGTSTTGDYHSFETGGKGTRSTSSDIVQTTSFDSLDDYDTGGGSKGKGTSTTGDYHSSDIGGRSTNPTGNYNLVTIGGDKSTSSNNDTGGKGSKGSTCEYFASDTSGGKSTSIGQ
jgi:hypothetical protein